MGRDYVALAHAPPVLETVCTMSERSSLHSCLSWLKLKFFKCTGKVHSIL